MKNCLPLVLVFFALASCSSVPEVEVEKPYANGAKSIQNEEQSWPSLKSVLSFGFTEDKFENGNGKVILDDISNFGNTRYSVVLIDGEEEERIRHPFVTYIPYVAMSPGFHRVTLVRNLNDRVRVPAANIVIEMDFELNCNYLVETTDNGVIIRREEGK